MALSGEAARSVTSEGATVFKALLQGSVEGSPELRSAQRLLSTLMDSMSSSVFWKDANSRFLGCNQAFADLAGMTIEEVIGKTDADMPWGTHGTGFTEWDNRVITEKVPFVDIREQLLDSEAEQRWIMTNKAPLLGADGDVIGLVGTFRDITNEVLAEADLQSALTQLDQRVTERTDQLLRANQSLRKEVDERVRLQAEERQLREYAEIRREIGAAMSRTIDLDKVLDVLVGGVQDLVTNDLAAIVLTDPQGRLAIERLETSYGYELGYEFERGQILDDHPALVTPSVPVGWFGTNNLNSALGPARSTIAAELVTGGVLIGYIVLESRWSDFYVAEHGERLKGVAEQASAVISNVRLTEQAAGLAAAGERDRLRRDLHDSVVQTLAAAALTVDTELVHMAADDPVRPAFERIQRLSTDANTEIRALLNDMRPGSLAKIDLVDLILRVANRPDWPFSIDVTTSLGRGEAYGEFTNGLFRIVQEALYNASRHANAQRVAIDLQDHPHLKLTITDDGIGFDPSAVSGDHMGLSIMAERAANLGGQFHVRSTEGKGTTIEVTLEASEG